jgi:hypothetical protein
MNDDEIPVPPPASEPPPWIVSQPPAEYPRSHHDGGSRLPVIAGLLVVLVLVVAAGGAWWVLRPDRPPPSAPVAEAPPEPADEFGGTGSGLTVTPTEEEEAEATPTPSPAPSTASPEPEADPQQAALDRLEELSRQGRAGVVLDGRYVAQLASKTPGIHDPLQTTATGSHTFEAVDILEEHESLRADPANGRARVVLLKSTDYGKRQLYRGEPLFVTFAIGDFAGAADVRSWCARRFPALSAEARANQCAVRRLRPPA